MDPSSSRTGPAVPPSPAERGSGAADDLAARLLAARLLAARRILSSLELAAEERARLQRRLLAICDAMKVSGADSRRCANRLDSFIEELGRAGSQGA